MNRNRMISGVLAALSASEAQNAMITLKKTEKELYAFYAQGRTAFSDSKDNRLTIRVTDGEKYGTASASVRADTDAYQAARTAIDEMRLDDGFVCDIPEEVEEKHLTHGCLSPDREDMQRYVDELSDYIRSNHPQIRVRVCNFSYNFEYTIWCDLRGKMASDQFGFYQIDISISAANEEKATCLFGATIDMQDLKNRPKDLVALETALCDAERMLKEKASALPKENTVVFAPSCMTMLCYQLFSSQLGDNAMSNRSSLWSGSFGQLIADEKLTVKIAPLEEGICGLSWMDESGREAKNTAVIENGVLRGTMLSPIAAHKLGLPEGNTSFCYTMEPGEKPLQEMIADITSGLLVTRLSGGTPTPGGEISMIAKGSFLIENGRIGAPCEGVCITGNLAKALQKIDGISMERAENGNSKLPYLRLSGLTLTGGGAE